MSASTAQDAPEDFAIDGEMLEMLRQSAAAFAGKRGLDRVRALRGEQPGLDRGAWQEMAEQGWLGVLLPEEFGGQGLPLSAMGTLTRELSRHLGPEPVVGCAVFAALTMLHAGNDAISGKLLPAIAAGETIYGVGWQSHLGGVEIDGTGVWAKAENGGYCLSGEVHYVDPALCADGFILAAKGAEDLILVRVDRQQAGVSVEAERRTDGTFSGTVRVEGVMVAPGDILAEGDAACTALARGKAAATIITAAELVGCMGAVFDLTLDYMKTRVQFDRPIGSFQALQHRAVDLFVQKELAASVLQEAIAAFDNGAEPDVLDMKASQAKARANHAGLLIGREAIKLHGAIAYTDEYDAGLYLQRILSKGAALGNAAEHRARYDVLMARAGGGLEEDRPERAVGIAPEFMAHEYVDTDWNQFSDAEFRAGVRAFFEANFPQHLRNLGRRGTPDEMGEWLDLLAAKRWLAVAWPVEHGGMGLSPAKQVIFIEERERVGIPRNPDQGVVMFGPMLMRYGTDVQKHKYLPKIVTNEFIWCQGYSEPNAGSDLASLRTSAVADGNDYVINGSKIWTTMAHHATHMFLLARTDPSVRKQDGISFFILDLETEGVTIRPITNIAGHEEFCEVFFDDVRVPAENLVGEINKGWGVAKSLLGFERLNNGSPRRVQGPLKSLRAVAEARGMWTDAGFREKYISIYLDITDLKSVYSRFCDIVSDGGMPGPEISQLKIWAGECAQRLSELLIETAGPAGGIVEAQEFSADTVLDAVAPFYAMFPSQIASGSNDIQRNVISRRVLDLPK